MSSFQGRRKNQKVEGAGQKRARSKTIEMTDNDEVEPHENNADNHPHRKP